MAMRLVQVSGTLRTEGNRPLAGATIRAELDRWDFAVGGVLAMPAATSAQTDEHGYCAFRLWTTASGAFVPTYRITISHYSIKTQVLIGISIPDVDALSLTRLLGGEDTDAPLGAILIAGGYLALSSGAFVLR